MDLAAGQEMLEAQLERALTEQIEGEHARTEYTAVVTDEMLTVTLRAECKKRSDGSYPLTSLDTRPRLPAGRGDETNS